MSDSSTTDKMIARLSCRAVLSAADCDAIRSLQFIEREAAAGTYLVREGARPTRCAFIVGGFTYRQKLTNDGARQIVSLQIPGDFIDLQNLFLRESDHNVQALTRVTVAEIDSAALRALALLRPAVATAMWIEALVEASVFREWIVNVGRRNAHERVGHLLCEFSLRLDAAGVARDRAYELPMTQEQLGDAVGLTPVHVNRVLKTLEQRGFIARDRRQVRIVDWKGLSEASDFTARYLHLEQGAI